VTRECGGCRGLGAHRPWCVTVVGRDSHTLWRMAEQAESLGDVCGEPAAASHLWNAAAILRAEAVIARQQHHARKASE